MSSLENKIDFALVFTVKNANPNGDPLDGNRPRTTNEGLGEVSDVCLKRKIRNRLLDMGQNIFVQSDDYRKEGDKFLTLQERANGVIELKSCMKTITDTKDNAVKLEKKEEYKKLACETWYDVRAFGQVFPFKSTTSEGGESDGVSIGIRGPVSIQPAFSQEMVNVTSMQITKSTSWKIGEKNNEKGTLRGSDTMGMKHCVDFGVYVTYGSISTQLASKTGFSHEDAELLKEVLKTLFRNDESSARPAGSMEVVKLIWWEHNCANGQYSSAKVHRTLKVSCDEEGNILVKTNDLDGLKPEIIDGE